MLQPGVKNKNMVCFELLIELRVGFVLHHFVEQKAWFVLSFSVGFCISYIRLILLFFVFVFIVLSFRSKDL